MLRISADFAASVWICPRVLRIYRQLGIRDDATKRVGAVQMKSPVPKRSIVVGGHKTSVNRPQGNLSSAIRLFVLDHIKTRAVGPAGELKLHASS